MAAVGNVVEGIATAIADEHELLELCADGDEAARDELFKRFMPMARRISRRYARAGEPLDDLMQVASMGLVKALERFDHRRGVPFAGYAAPTIEGELKRYLRDTTWAAHVPQRMRERSLEVVRATERLRLVFGRSPTTDEVAGDLDVTVTEVLDAAEAATAHDALSLDSPTRAEDDTSAWVDRIGTEESRYDLVEYGATIAPVLRALPARERAILRMRFVEDMTQCEIADALGISQMHVSRLLRRALGRLRAAAHARHAA